MFVVQKYGVVIVSMNVLHATLRDVCRVSCRRVQMQESHGLGVLHSSQS